MLASLHARRTPLIEWPTLLLAVVIYGCWLALTYCHAMLPWPVLALLGGWLLAWQMSLQHEILHGHPTRIRWINDAIGFPPLTLWLPYQVYRHSHLRHHRDEHLTDPLEDPESAYLTPERWGRMGGFARGMQRVRNTFLGRITVGAVDSIAIFLISQLRRCLRGERGTLRLWLPHLLGVAAILVWLTAVCHLSIGVYILCFVLPSRSLALIRSFAEHRAAAARAERTAIVENSRILGLLFLNNNLHALHHDRPSLAWYRLPAAYRKARGHIIAANGGLVYDGYWDVLRRYLHTPHHIGAHPGFAAPRQPLPAPVFSGEASQARMGYPAATAARSNSPTAA